MHNDKPQWREMTDQARADAYSPSTVLPDGDLMPFIQAYIDDSLAAYTAFPDVQTLRYGPRAANTVDLLVPDAPTPAPLLVFIHGGYWQELSKREAFFPAGDALAQGMAFASVDYTLAPSATLDEIVTECTDAVTMLMDRAPSLGVDPARIILSGSSAGAHLAAMCCLQLPADQQPKGVALLSGVYTLEPLIGTYINDAVRMDLDRALRNSPALKNLSGFPPCVIAWGEQETDEFKRQSRFFGKILKEAECKVDMLEIPQRNHFDLAFDIANRSSLGTKTAGLIDG
jgi:arylformamidase